MRLIAIACISTCFAVGMVMAFRASAELSPWTYRAWQDRASDVADVEIVSVETDELGHGAAGRHIDVKADAKVVAVERSEAGIAVGSIVCLHYDVWNADDPLPGATPIRIVATGNRLKAFLAKRDDSACFAPAAEGQSFIDLTAP